MDQRDCWTRVLEELVVCCRMLVPFCQTTQHHSLEDYNLGLLCVNIPLLVLSAFWPRKVKLLSEAQVRIKSCSTVRNDSYVLQYNILCDVLLSFRFFIFKLVGFLATFWVNLLMARILSIRMVVIFLYFVLTIHFLLYFGFVGLVVASLC
jgi:hypothetical protein